MKSQEKKTNISRFLIRVPMVQVHPGAIKYLKRLSFSCVRKLHIAKTTYTTYTDVHRIALSLTILFMIVVLSSCATNVRPGVCRHHALFAASVYGEDYPVRISFGPAKNITGKVPWWHAQAKAKIDGKWCWLQTSGDKVWVGDKEQFDDLNTYTLDDYIKFMGFGKE